MPDISGAVSGTGNLYSGVAGGNNPAAVPTGGAFLGVQDAPAPSGLVTEGYPQGTAITGSTAMTPAIQAIWSKEILFEAMPILRFEQFAVKKTELGVAAGSDGELHEVQQPPVQRGHWWRHSPKVCV